MPRNPNERDEKLEARDIRITPQGGAKVEKQHGKLYQWFDNFWYHHKWKVIVIALLLVVLTVCVVQCATRDDKKDATLVLAGPYGFANDETGYRQLLACLTTLLPEDYDGDGSKKIQMVHYSFYSDEVIAEYEAEGIMINRAENATNKQNFSKTLTFGEASVLFIDPYLFEELCKSKHLVDLETLLGADPAGGIKVENGAGELGVWGVALSETKLYKDNTAVQKLPEDTVVCLFAKTLHTNDEEYARRVAYLKALLGVAE